MDKKVIVKLENFGKNYGEKIVIRNVDLEVYEGEFLTLLGSSGCGKTTILRSISGLDKPTKGKVFIDGDDVTNLEPQIGHFKFSVTPCKIADLVSSINLSVTLS